MPTTPKKINCFTFSANDRKVRPGIRAVHLREEGENYFFDPIIWDHRFEETYVPAMRLGNTAIKADTEQRPFIEKTERGHRFMRGALTSHQRTFFIKKGSLDTDGIILSVNFYDGSTTKMLWFGVQSSSGISITKGLNSLVILKDSGDYVDVFLKDGDVVRIERRGSQLRRVTFSDEAVVTMRINQAVGQLGNKNLGEKARQGILFGMAKFFRAYPDSEEITSLLLRFFASQRFLDDNIRKKIGLTLSERNDPRGEMFRTVTGHRKFLSRNIQGQKGRSESSKRKKTKSKKSRERTKKTKGKRHGRKA